MNAILREDFEYIASAGLDWDRLDHRTVFITGGTGFLGSLLIRFLHYLNETRRRGIRIVALVRDPGKARAILGDADVVLVQGDMCALPPLPMEIDYIFHCAAVTNSKLMIEQPVEVTEGMVLGTYEIMKLARLKKVSSMVYLSSMEVYGQIGLRTARRWRAIRGTWICTMRAAPTRWASGWRNISVSITGRNTAFR